jgi:hypothetical protein
MEFDRDVVANGPMCGSYGVMTTITIIITMPNPPFSADFTLVRGERFRGNLPAGIERT